jgi:hypothetical protein
VISTKATVSPDEIKETSIKICFDSLYRLMLRYNNWEDDRVVAKTIVKCVQNINLSWALEVCATAKMNSTAIIVTVTEVDAIVYRDRLNRNGLDAFVEEA